MDGIVDSMANSLRSFSRLSAMWCAVAILHALAASELGVCFAKKRKKKKKRRETHILRT